MIETNWFQDRGVDEPPKTVRLGWLIWVALAASMILAPMLYGCGTIDGICAIQPIGKDERGVAVVRYHCEPI